MVTSLTTLLRGSLRTNPRGVKKLFAPSVSHPARSQRSHHVDNIGDYDHALQDSLTRPEYFWGDAAEKLVWHKKWDRVLDHSNPPFTKWFVGGEISACYNAVDRHVDEGRGDQVAFIHDSPLTNSVTHVTYAQFHEQVRLLADVLRRHGVEKGDRVVIYMPMIPEACVAMLACGRLGATHSLVFGGFAPKELATRIDHAKPKVLLTSNCGIEPGGKIVNYKANIDAALAAAKHAPNRTIVFDRPQAPPATLNPQKDANWQEEVDSAQGVDCVPVSASDTMYIIYSSGTTGLPKGIQRPVGGQIVCLHWSMKNVYGLDPGEPWLCASDLGWVVGHCYICYAPLLSGNPSVIYEGKPANTPDAGALWRVISQHNVSAVFTAPTFVRTVRREDSKASLMAPHDLSRLKRVYLAGEHCDPDTLLWLKRVLGGNIPVLDHWWQTETGYAMSAACVGLGDHGDQPVGSAGKRVPGWNLQVLRDDGSQADANELGTIVSKMPLPPAAFDTLYKADDRFVSTYFSKFPGYYDTQDAGKIDENGYVYVISRQDDVINVSGKRIAGGSIEEAIMEHSDVAECCVVAVPDPVQGERPIGIVVPKGSSTRDHAVVEAEIVGLVRTNVGPVAGFKTVVTVPKLPKTRSGKIPRKTIVSLAMGKPFDIPVTIEDASVYGPLKEALVKVGLGGNE